MTDLPASSVRVYREKTDKRICLWGSRRGREHAALSGRGDPRNTRIE